MSIVAMKKLRLIAARSQQEDILRELMLLGCVEISTPSEGDVETSAGLRRAEGGTAYKNRADQQKMLSALKLLDRYSTAKGGLLSPQPEIKLSRLLDESSLGQAMAAADRIMSLDVRMRGITASESREKTTIEAMQPWESMPLPLERRGTETCDILLGTVSGTAPFSMVQEAFDGLEAEAEEIYSDKTSRWIAVVYSKTQRDEISAALRSCGFTQFSTAGMTGTPLENIQRAQKHLDELAVEKAETEAQLIAEVPERELLQLGVDTLSTVIARQEAAEKLLNTESTFCFEGWITAPEEETLAEKLSAYSCAWETEEPDPEHPEEVPIKLKNNPLTEPYNLVTEMYSLPAYNGIDPNPFIMPFFALFFGIMFADMAYGLILFAAGLLITYKAKPKAGGMKQISGLLIECGITTFLMGFLTGGFFGDAVSIVGSWFGKEWSIVPSFGAIHLGSIEIGLPINLLEGNNPLYILIAAICLGAVHLAVGVGIGMYLKIKDGEWVDALLNDLCWWVMLVGIGLMALGKGNIVLYVGIGMMVLGQLITGEGFGKITGIFGAVYNGATGYLGDFLSYSRLMALMLAGSVIASVFNQLGALGNSNGITVGGTILFIAVFCIGHALNFGLNIIGCFVHTLRLQYLEFFGKWYRDGGRQFKPLTIKTKFFDIIKEDK